MTQFQSSERIPTPVLETTSSLTNSNSKSAPFLGNQNLVTNSTDSRIVNPFKRTLSCNSSASSTSSGISTLSAQSNQIHKNSRTALFNGSVLKEKQNINEPIVQGKKTKKVPQQHTKLTPIISSKNSHHSSSEGLLMLTVTPKAKSHSISSSSTSSFSGFKKLLGFSKKM